MGYEDKPCSTGCKRAERLPFFFRRVHGATGRPPGERQEGRLRVRCGTPRQREPQERRTSSSVLWARRGRRCRLDRERGGPGGRCAVAGAAGRAAVDDPRDQGGTGRPPGGLQTSLGKNVLFKGGLQPPPPGRDPESGDRSRLLGIDPPTTTEVLGDGVSSRVGGSMWTGSSMLSGPASWRWPDDAPRGQNRRVWRGHRIDPASLLNDPPAYRLVRAPRPGLAAPGRGARERRPRPRRADGPAQARRPEPRARDIDLG
jgi:hypothetical protein